MEGGLELIDAAKLISDLGFDVLQYHGDFEPSGEVMDLINDLGIKLAPVLTYVGDKSIIDRATKLSLINYVEYVLIDAPKTNFTKYEHGLKLPLDVIREASAIPRLVLPAV